MGLDIAFHRILATKAGISTKDIPNGDPSDIEVAREQVAQGEASPGYLHWLQRTATCVQVPGMDWWVEDNGSPENFVIRANRWGYTYAPLTAWLKEHSIPWIEF
ncbi:hypothetical protein [Kineobactrum salinum]|uniref:Uncharacterized protein n=1 Tax=Kineobactrum salinum TaxID=2708301 RepID=A0A6C0U971_9GAMM|nr:hypothetical protein [Kineobactrum salinum]QIB67155.1 hypothetical protein G3T16_18860 [Kineobactrum salinum]